METKELKITIPENHEIDWQESAKQEKIVFKKKDTKPRSWEEYCKQTSANTHWNFGGSYGITTVFTGTSCEKLHIQDAGSVPSKEFAEAFLAMTQLISLRQAWIGDWKPDWSRGTYCIATTNNGIFATVFVNFTHPLSFPTQEMVKDFMNCFKDLLEIAKPLI